jgi:dihydrofolate synthase/folylpolyglutamate synthase
VADLVEQALERAARRKPDLISLGLDRVHDALGRLGAPHRRLPPTFHVAGTNGKGSTCAYLRGILEASGGRVHVFTSPHLVRYTERIVLAGAEIGERAMADLIDEVGRTAYDCDLTWFEVITCAAFLAFDRTPADFLVLEVGLGGRLDATNVIERPTASIVTPIALDHMQFLGTTLAEIAAEKAGIFRPGAPAAIGPQTPEAMAAIERAAAATGAELHACGAAWTFWRESGRLAFQDMKGLADLDPPRLFGDHQYANAALAVAATRAAGLDLSDRVLSAGIGAARWPARLQRLKSGPIVDLFARSETETWLDGGHNPHAARAVAAAMAGLEERASKPLVLIAGLQATKDAEGFFDAFSGLAREVVAVAAEHRGAAPAESIAAAARAADIPATTADGPLAAARMIRQRMKESVRLLICGSLYLAGEVLRDHR